MSRMLLYISRYTRLNHVDVNLFSIIRKQFNSADRAKRPVWARESCRINPPRFMVECRKRRLNQASFVLLCFMLFAFSGLCSVCVASVFDLSSVTYFPVYRLEWHSIA